MLVDYQLCNRHHPLDVCLGSFKVDFMMLCRIFGGYLWKYLGIYLENIWGRGKYLNVFFPNHTCLHVPEKVQILIFLGVVQWPSGVMLKKIL